MSPIHYNEDAHRRLQKWSGSKERLHSPEILGHVQPVLVLDQLHQDKLEVDLQVRDCFAMIHSEGNSSLSDGTIVSLCNPKGSGVIIQLKAFWVTAQSLNFDYTIAVSNTFAGLGGVVTPTGSIYANRGVGGKPRATFRQELIGIVPQGIQIMRLSDLVNEIGGKWIVLPVPIVLTPTDTAFVINSTFDNPPPMDCGWSWTEFPSAQRG